MKLERSVFKACDIKDKNVFQMLFFKLYSVLAHNNYLAENIFSIEVTSDSSNGYRQF